MDTRAVPAIITNTCKEKVTFQANGEAVVIAPGESVATAVRLSDLSSKGSTVTDEQVKAAMAAEDAHRVSGRTERVRAMLEAALR